jgi:nucleotide-binding universal stress UspA family protein
MYNKILVPLDGSEFSECTLGHVKTIAMGCQIPNVVLFRVVKPLPDTYGTAKGLRREADEKAENHVKEYLAEVADRLKKEGLAVETAVAHGLPAEEILDYAKKNGVDLIIMSTHGRSGVSRLAFGSVTDKVLRNSITPVLTVAPQGCRIDE